MESETADDLTVISRLGDVAAKWLAGYGVDKFRSLSELNDDDIANLSAVDDLPGGVSVERLREWRDDAAKRIG